MNTIKIEINWPKLRQELVPIIFLSMSHVWWTFNFPAYIRLGSPWNIIVSLYISGISIVSYIIAFSTANRCASYLSLDSFDDLPEAHIYSDFFKKLTRGSIVAIALITILFLWRIDFYGMPDLYYAAFYTHIIATFALWYRAVYRKPL